MWVWHWGYVYRQLVIEPCREEVDMRPAELETDPLEHSRVQHPLRGGRFVRARKSVRKDVLCSRDVHRSY